MHYEQKYKEALKKARSLCAMPTDKAMLEEIFPELKKSEDERIRETLIKYVEEWQKGHCKWNSDKDFCNNVIAWLEKKGEQKTVPKFKIGDTMRTIQEARDGWTDGVPFVVSIDSEYYNCNSEKIAIKDQDSYEYPPMNRIQKPAWSEEDEERLNSIIESYETLCKEYKNCHDVDFIPYDSKTVVRTIKGDIDWLKSLKERMKGE